MTEDFFTAWVKCGWHFEAPPSRKPKEEARFAAAPAALRQFMSTYQALRNRDEPEAIP